MRHRSASASRFSYLLPAVVTLLSVACHETTTPAVPAKLAFTVQPPAVTTAGETILPAVSVAVQDADGKTVTTATTSITLTIGTNPPSGTLSGTTIVAAVNGVAIFSNLSVNRAGTGYTLAASAQNLTSVTSRPFEVKTGPAAKLTFSVQPVTTIANITIPPVSVAMQDAGGNTVVNAVNNITVQIGNNPASAVLFGNGPVSTLNGVATFSNLSISKAGSGFTLSAATPGLVTAISATFDVRIGPANKLEFIAQPLTTSPGATLVPAVVVAVRDVGGNTVPSATHSITLAIGANPAGGTLSGTTTVVAVNGVATFSDLSINKAGSDYTLTAAAAAAADIAVRTSTPFSIRDPLAFTTVSAGYFHSCGLGARGVAYCWGDNAAGQAGNPALSQSSSPTGVVGGLTFAKVSTGRTHTCGVTAGGVAYCWGSNTFGELSSGASPNGTSTPAAVSGGLTFAAVSAGYSHTCGVTTGGVGYCWGDNSSGELGSNGTLLSKNVPTAVSGGLTFASISSGRLFTCGVTTAGVAYCWGNNPNGELGDGTTIARATPAPVSGQLTFAVVSAGGFHACGLTPGGVAYCWGLNHVGQLSNGTGLASSTTPVAVSGGLTFATLSAGNRHTCAVTAAGAGYCWGDNSLGHLGDGTLTGGVRPSAVAGGLIFASISAGRFHTCGVTTSNEGYCWGDDGGSGKLGVGTIQSSLVPLRIR